MTKKILILLSAALMIIPIFADISWHSNIEDALQRAKKYDKHVFLFFTGSDWCTWCHRLHDEVFDHKEFQDYAKKNMEMVMLDFPRSKKLDPDTEAYNQNQAQKYGVRGFPSVIILDKEGEVAMQLGYQEGGPVKYVEFIDNVLNWDKAELMEPWVSDSGQKWYRNLDQAQELAVKDNKHILVNFTGSDWCTWCHRLRDEVFEQPEFSDFAENELVLVRLDFPKSFKLPAGEESYNRTLLQKYGVRGFPSIFLLDKKGRTVQKLGYEAGGAENYVSMLQDLIN